MENLIEIKPQTKSKGFHNLNLNSEDVDNIYPLIGLIEDLGDLSQNEKSIVSNIDL